MQASDRELLELAAKAIGGILSEGTGKRRIGPTWDEWEWYGPVGIQTPAGTIVYPLTDDGDALRLAVRLGLGVGQHLGAAYAGVIPSPDDYEDGRFPVRVAERINDDSYAATRRAIVRAAAEIGRSRE